MIPRYTQRKGISTLNQIYIGFDTHFDAFLYLHVDLILLTDHIYSVLKRIACFQIDNRDNLFVIRPFHDHQGS